MKTQEQLKEMYRQIQIERWHGDKKMVDYCVNKTAYIIERANGDIITIDKPSIEKSFCFGYSDSPYNTDDYDRANKAAAHAQTNTDYFKSENLKPINEIIETLSGQGRFKAYTWEPKENTDREKSIHFSTPCRVWDNPDYKPLSEEETKKLLEGYKIVKANFEKRLDTYLKRYGTSKVKSWSYWRDA